VASDDNDRQFDGDGTAAHPPLYNRDVLAFLPFQLSANRYVVPVYVMTRNMATLYKPDAPGSDTTRLDLPPADYRLTIAGVDGSTAGASATDPITGKSVPVKVTSRLPDRFTVQLPLTDYPRLLQLVGD
jgi:hypothetical protein